MKYLLILIGLVLCLNVHSQTEALEVQNIVLTPYKLDIFIKRV
jgi:hypothetical protein